MANVKTIDIILNQIQTITIPSGIVEIFINDTLLLTLIDGGTY